MVLPVLAHAALDWTYAMRRRLTAVFLRNSQKSSESVNVSKFSSARGKPTLTRNGRARFSVIVEAWDYRQKITRPKAAATEVSS